MSKEQEFVKLTHENPDSEIVFMYPDECSDYSYTRGRISKVFLDEYVTIDDRVWIRGQDEDELFDDIADGYYDEVFPTISRLTDEQEAMINAEAKKRINALNWKKAIVVYIKPN